MADKQIIFYGAGQEAHDNFLKWVDEGLVPVCFADADTNKHYTKLHDVDILPLDEAIERYPNYELCVTLGSEKLKPVTEWLVKRGIPAVRIGYAHLEWRRGCNKMDTNVHINPNIAPCCNWRFGERIPATGDWAGDYELYVHEMNELIGKLRNNEPCKCDDCPELVEGYFYREFTPRKLICSASFKGEVCNCKCCYCGLTKSGSSARGGKFYLLDTLRDLSIVLPERIDFTYTSAEISVTPSKKEVYDFMEKNKWTMGYILTNAIIYDERIADMLANGSVLDVSLDSGTPETYKRVKGVDCFDKVVNNVEKYYLASNCRNEKILLKYILLSNMNDNKRDIDGFINIAARVSSTIGVTVDARTRVEGLDEALWYWMEYLVEQAKKHNLICHPYPEHHNEADFERLRMLIEKA